jgi:hypothetical protein
MILLGFIAFFVGQFSSNKSYTSSGDKIGTYFSQRQVGTKLEQLLLDYF